MNCDEVFAILTRGPFPSGDRHDRLVEVHLQLCLDCQRLAEAIRPNDENRPEAVAPEDTVSLPGYWGGPLDAEIHPIISLAKTAGQPQSQRKRASKGSQSQRRQRISLGQFTAAVTLGIVVAAVVRTLLGGSELPNSAAPRGPSGFAVVDGSQDLTFDHRGSVDEFPPHCLRKSFDPSGILAFSENQLSSFRLKRVVKDCCNQCHHGGSPSNSRSDEAKAELRRNCAACHDWISP